MTSSATSLRTPLFSLVRPEEVGARSTTLSVGTTVKTPNEGEDDIPFRFDSVVFVDVTCKEPGEFDLSVILAGIPLAGVHGQMEVLCKGEVEAA